MVHDCKGTVRHTSVNLERDTSLLHFFVSGNVVVSISWDSFLAGIRLNMCDTHHFKYEGVNIHCFRERQDLKSV